MKQFRLDFISILIFYWCSLGGGTDLLRRIPRQALCQGKFECLSGGCIDTSDVCNGIAQCADGSDESPDSCKCGIVNGARSRANAPGVRDAQIGSHPWHVGIYRTRSSNHNTLICIGTLIFSDIVLTSANCVFDRETFLSYPASAIRVSGGKLKRDYNVDEPHQQRFRVSKIVIMDRYEGDTKGYLRNLALLKLTEVIKPNQFVSTACLWPSKALPNVDLKTSIVGWGLQYSGSYAVNLREANANSMDIGACMNKFQDPLYRRFLTVDKFCLTFDQGVGLKDDDTGGPVTVDYDGRHFLVGVLSVKVAGSNFGIATKVGKHINWIRNSSYHLKQVDRCSQTRHFRCNSGCILPEQVCDGKKDCEDGSDEHEAHCTSSTSGGRGKSCRIPDWVESFEVLTCDDPDGCKSSHLAPQYSTYNITCPVGYAFADPSMTDLTVVCTGGGKWVPDIQNNRCLRLCPKQEKKSLQFHCSYRGQSISCDQDLRPDTVILVDCKRQYKKQALVNFANRTICRKDGSIQHELSDCVPVCGVEFNIEETEVQISNGKKVEYAKYPWHTGLYWKEGGRFEYKCGGTIIASNKVLTAAHCVWDDSRNQIVAAHSLAIATGKLHSNWHYREINEQKIGVTQVIQGLHYSGAKTKHSHDIAVLILSKELTLSGYTMPACLDLDLSYGGIPPKQMGHVVGWGRLSEDDDHPSDNLMETWLQYLDLDSCRKRYERTGFIEYLHPDKFCVLYTNGSGTQTGDSGGGLTFLHDQLHYVYGVVSIKRKGQNEFAAFTNVLSHRTWLQEILDNY